METEKLEEFQKESHYWEVHHKRDTKLILASARCKGWLKRRISKLSQSGISYIESHYIVKHWRCKFYLTKSGRLKIKMKLVEKFNLNRLQYS